jgi:hypothetical protein
VRQLVSKCGSDIEKARTIFRWITVKNLNTMQFDENLRGDTPMGLLRGIKHGTESYHVLFKRLCSYAGLHCVVIKGYSKSAGYQPGVRFEDNRFRNSWNAVYVAGSWRFVQCNWGARHLVNAKEVPHPGQPKEKSDSLRSVFPFLLFVFLSLFHLSLITMALERSHGLQTFDCFTSCIMTKIQAAVTRSRMPFNITPLKCYVCLTRNTSSIRFIEYSTLIYCPNINNSYTENDNQVDELFISPKLYNFF